MTEEIARKFVPLEQIDEIAALQVRQKIDSPTVAAYETIIQECGRMDPLILFRQASKNGDAPRYWLAAGTHRIRAYRNLGHKVAPAEIREGGLSEALACAIESNIKHGLPMSRADKRHAARMLVEDPVHGQKKDATLARMLSVSPSFINEVRRGIRPEDKKAAAKKEPPAPAKADAKPEPAPAPSSRKPKESDPRPTKSAILKRIENDVDLDMVDEKDVVELFKSGNAEYVFMPRPGVEVPLKIISKTGRVLFERRVVMKERGVEGIVVKAEDLSAIEVTERGA